MSSPQRPDIVPEPFAHISISGVHGGAELDQRIRAARPHLRDAQIDTLKPFLIGAAVGAVLVYLLKR